MQRKFFAELSESAAILSSPCRGGGELGFSRKGAGFGRFLMENMVLPCLCLEPEEGYFQSAAAWNQAFLGSKAGGSLSKVFGGECLAEYRPLSGLGIKESGSGQSDATK